MRDLATLRSMRCQHTTAQLDQPTLTAQLALLPAWEIENQAIQRIFHFRDYYDTISFVNALAYQAHYHDHHPDLQVSYNRCVVRFSTHSAHGISWNDVICAAWADSLVTG